MFIAHGEKVRKHARWILLAVLVLLIPGFIALFTPSGRTQRDHQDNLPTVRGKPVDRAAFDQARQTVVAQFVINSGGRVPRTREFNDLVTSETVRHMVLVGKAREMGVHVPEEELVAQIRQLPMWRNENKQFDPELYQQFIIRLSHEGISETMFGQLVQEDLMLQRLRDLVTAGAIVTPLEVKLAYGPLHEKIAIEYVEFKADEQAPAGVPTDADLKAYFDQHPESFRTPERVKVRYARFSVAEAKKQTQVSDEEIAEYYERNKMKYVDAEQKPKPIEAVKEQIRGELLDLRAEQRARDRATEFSVKLVPEPDQPRPDFAKLAAAYGATAQETGFFGQEETVPGIAAGPKFSQTAFALGPEGPFSDPLEGNDAYYVLEYLDHQPSGIPAFADVKEKVVKQLQSQRQLEAAVKRGQEMAAQLKKLVVEGKSFIPACTDLGLKPVTPAAFTLAGKAPPIPAGTSIMDLALGMPANAVSDFIPTAKGGVVFHLRERLPPNPQDFEKDKDQFTQQVATRNRDALWRAWVAALMHQEQVSSPPPTAGTQAPAPEDAPEPEPTPSQG